jgi:hypothetical protein
VDRVIDDQGMSLAEYGIPGKVLYHPVTPGAHITILIRGSFVVI